MEYNELESKKYSFHTVVLLEEMKKILQGIADVDRTDKQIIADVDRTDKVNAEAELKEFHCCSVIFQESIKKILLFIAGTSVALLTTLITFLII